MDVAAVTFVHQRNRGHGAELSQVKSVKVVVASGDLRGDVSAQSMLHEVVHVSFVVTNFFAGRVLGISFVCSMHRSGGV